MGNITKTIFVTVALFVAGCGSSVSYYDPTSPEFFNSGDKRLPAREHDPKIQALMNDFLDDAHARGKDASPRLKDLRVTAFWEGLKDGRPLPVKGASSETKALLGACVEVEGRNAINHKSTGTYLFIYLDSSLLEGDESILKAVAYHEFYHCLFSADHVDTPEILSTLFDKMVANHKTITEAYTAREIGYDEYLARYYAEIEAHYDRVLEHYSLMMPSIWTDPGFLNARWDALVDRLFEEGR